MPSFSLHTDEQLLGLLKSGNEGAFTEIYHRYAEGLYNFAWNILKKEDECMDAVQEVFVWLWENRENLQVTVLKYYLFAAVKYKLIRIIRNSKRRAEIIAPRPVVARPCAEEVIELKELQAIIAEFTEGLPARAGRIFHLSRNECLTNRQIAARLKISEKTVENQMTIVLRKLRHTLSRMSFWSLFL